MKIKLEIDTGSPKDLIIKSKIIFRKVLTRISKTDILYVGAIGGMFFGKHLLDYLQVSGTKNTAIVCGTFLFAYFVAKAITEYVNNNDYDFY